LTAFHNSLAIFSGIFFAIISPLMRIGYIKLIKTKDFKMKL